MTPVTWLDAAERAAAVFAACLPRPEARGEGWRFTAAAAGVPVSEIIPLFTRMPIPCDQLTAVETAIDRLESGEPAAYVIGSIPFHNVDVNVDRRALIPRPETEILVEEVIRWCSARRMSAPRILDAGTGSGCIAMALARAIPDAVITAVDISPEALRLASHNLRRSGLLGRVRLIRANWLEWARGQWDVIVSNPPYVTADELATLPAVVASWEPMCALDGGPDGFIHLARLLTAAVTCLASGGLLALEMSPTLTSLALRVAEAEGLKECRVVPDFTGRDRFLLAITREENPC